MAEVAKHNSKSPGEPGLSLSGMCSHQGLGGVLLSRLPLENHHTGLQGVRREVTAGLCFTGESSTPPVSCQRIRVERRLQAVAGVTREGL